MVCEASRRGGGEAVSVFGGEGGQGASNPPHAVFTVDIVKFEKVEMWLVCGSTLGSDAGPLVDGRAIRGFFGNLYRNRPEFHGHGEKGLIYRHPLIQYKVLGSTPVITGLGPGAYLLKAVPEIDEIEIHHRKYRVIRNMVASEIVEIGCSESLIEYRFVTPWIGLNEKNHERYLRVRRYASPRKELLERILVGNLLSMAKGLGVMVGGRLTVEAGLEETGTAEVKDGVRLAAFSGGFRANFHIPNLWGIGKSSSRGYGTVRRANGG